MTFPNPPRQRPGSMAPLAAGLMTLWGASLAIMTPSMARRESGDPLRVVVETLQARIGESREVRAEFVAKFWYQRTGIVQLRQRKPDWFLVDAAAWGDNPREVCWLEYPRAEIFQEWPQRGTRGVRIDNLSELFGEDRERAFESMLHYSERFVATAGVGLTMLRMIGSAPVEKLTLQEVEGAVRASIDVRDLKEPDAKDFVTLDGKQTMLVFEVQRPRSGTPMLRWVGTEHEGVPREAGTSAKFSRLDFVWDPADAPLPVIPDELLKPVRLTKPEDFRPSVIDSLPLGRNGVQPAPRGTLR